MAGKATKTLMVISALLPVAIAIALFLMLFDIRQLTGKARLWALDALGGQPVGAVAGPPQGGVSPETPSRVENAYQSLSKDLEPQLKTKEVTIARGERTLEIRFMEKVLFRSGSAQITTQGDDILAKTGQALKNFEQEYIAVVGHTDNVPINTSLFPSNWELSTNRACAVVHFLSEKSGIDPTRFYAIGRGEYEPAFANDSDEGKAGNRRVDIIVSDMTCLRDLKPSPTDQAPADQPSR